MPELPEVETVRRGLERLIVGMRIRSVDHDNPKSFPNPKSDVENFLIGAHIKAVSRRAKVLLIDLDSDYSLVIHLKMTGQLVFVDDKNLDDSKSPGTRFGAGHPNDSLVGKLPDKSTRVTIGFEDGSRLFFNDQRKFGWMKLYPTPEVMNIDFMQRVGPEPLGDNFSVQDFIARMRGRNGTTIKAALLDQTVVAGVGNIYADECLWGALIHPAERVRDVSDAKMKSLYEELRYVLSLAIEKGGSTDRNYLNAEGKRGSYLDFARVFRREGLACPRCQETIIKTRVAGRGTHLCPREQVLEVER